MSVRGGRLAVMEDDTVLCADCLDKYQAEEMVQTAAIIVHAWLSGPAGEACRCCGATDNDEAVVAGQGETDQ